MPSKTSSSKTTATKSSSRKVAARKTTPRTSTSSRSRKIKTDTEESVDVYPVSTSSSSEQSFMSVKPRRSLVIAVIAALILLFVLFEAKGLFVAAIVNNQPIWRLSVIQELEKQSGSQALQSLITDSLIKQAADQKGITVSQKDLDAQINLIKKNLSAQGQTLDSALKSQNMTMQQLDDEITTQKMVEKLVGPVKVTDKDILDYMDKNKDSLQPGTTPSQVGQQLQQQQLQQKEQAYVANLQAKAKVIRWVNY